jgi:leucyl-tRNA synthetase
MSPAPGVVEFPEELRRKIEAPAGHLSIEEARAALKANAYTLEGEEGAWEAVSGPVTMSKSAGNGVPVGPFVSQYGSDVARTVVLFAAPPENSMEWTDEGVAGAQRFLNRIVALFQPDREAIARVGYGGSALDPSSLSASEKALYRKLHATIKKVTQDTESFRFNTAIAAMMELLNELVRYRGEVADATPIFVRAAHCYARLLAPFTPHLAEELHEWFGGAGSIYDAGWPAWDEAALVEDEIEVVLQVNGKLRGKINVPADADETQLREWALTNERVQSFIGGKPVCKMIVVPGKLVNIVV